MIGAVIAMTSEANILKDLMTVREERKICNKSVYIGALADIEIVLIVCGVGKVNAAIGAQMLIDLFHADKILNFGVAGGISETTETTEVYLISHAVEYDFDLSELNHTKIGTPDELTDNRLPLFLPAVDLPRRVLATGDRFNDSPADHDLIEHYMQADIRDMEGAAIARTCMHAGVPVTEVKAISDKYGSNSSFEQYRANMNTALSRLKGYLPDIIRSL